jgi:GTP1/Obg family GTP-binding protein
MPWPALSHVVDGDLSAIFAYLQSLPPIDNEVPAAVVAGPPPAIEE